MNLINQISTSQDENCDESEDGQIIIEIIVTSFRKFIERMKWAGFVKPVGHFFGKSMQNFICKPERKVPRWMYV